MVLSKIILYGGIALAVYFGVKFFMERRNELDLDNPIKIKEDYEGEKFKWRV